LNEGEEEEEEEDETESMVVLKSQMSLVKNVNLK
jgi:hypothetical protein